MYASFGSSPAALLMQTIVLEQPGQFRLTDTAPPARPTANQALVRVRRIGICGTDLHAYRGRQPFFSYPRILGHELGVEVLEVAENAAGIEPGDRCAVEPYLNCGTCVACRRGKTNCCTSLQCLGVHTDGGMRETVLLPTHKLHRSDQLTLDQLALVETLGIGAHAVSRGQLAADDTVLVIGAGPIGLATAQFALLTGAQVVVLDMNAGRLEFCRRELGVPQTIFPQDDPIPQICEAFGGELPTKVFDATGNAGSMQRAFSLVANSGTLVLVGLVQGELTFNDPEFHRRELSVLSSRNSTANDFRRIIGLLESGQIDTTPWITHRSNFAGMIADFESWLHPKAGVVKAMVEA